MHTLLIVLEILVCVVLIISVLLQPGKADGFNLISSGSETFLSKNKTKTAESFLARTTVISSVVFGIVTVALTFVR